MLSLITFSCNKEVPHIDEPLFVLDNPGVFIVNEGNFTFGNSSLTYFNIKDSTFIHDLFYRVNGVPLGDVANYMTLYNNNGYVVVNNSGVVYEIDANTGEYKGKISGLVSPRELIFIDNNRVLISDIAEPFLTLVNINSQGTYGKIDLDGRTAESMVKTGDKLFAVNWSAMYQEKKNNMVLVIDLNDLKLMDSIEVTIEPNSLQLDKNGDLWVLCSGGYNNEEIPALYKIDINTDSVLAKLEFRNIASSPGELHINKTGDMLYFINNDIYKMSIYSDSIPEEPFIKSNGSVFYSLGIDPSTGDIYVSDAGNYMQKGKVFVYDTTGNIKMNFLAGIIPGYFCFKE